ncbi:translation initiation factor IF-2-like [Pipra filicauda]|uniref:Translation initiation factor IF-2-like n=1 Tax=Pipra filicauda TaxID=649802 RepID=A0A7R5KSL6_9PASS|nr:translation initiation factor IF-2-like [Pipra filicauda]
MWGPRSPPGQGALPALQGDAAASGPAEAPWAEPAHTPAPRRRLWRREGAGSALAAPGPGAPRPPQAAARPAQPPGQRSLRRPRWRRQDLSGVGSGPAGRSEQVGTTEPAGRLRHWKSRARRPRSGCVSVRLVRVKNKAWLMP